ncbi:MAG: hypothetical protein OEW09_11465, partial [Anaerolineae bacterium]|nr:hypothetical protein [Anaerolineae bacterium]
MKGKVIGVLIVLLSIALLVGVAVVGAQQGEPPPRGQLISSRSDPAWQSLARRGWSAERMQNAKPYPMPAVEPGTDRGCGTGSGAPTGAPGLIPSGPEEVEYSLADVLGSIERFPASAASPAPLGYPYPPPYTRYEVFKKYT